jgi:non-ribosomal peptide synthetase component F
VSGRDWLGERARRDRDGPAIIGETVSPGGVLDARAAQAAGRLRRLGVRPGDRLALLAGTSVDTVTVIHAASRAGAILVPLNPRLAAEEASGGGGLRARLRHNHRASRRPAYADLPGLPAPRWTGRSGDPGWPTSRPEKLLAASSRLVTIVYTSARRPPEGGVIIPAGATGRAPRRAGSWVWPEDR